jgi:DNA-binding beta-propeller fold protein YncE
MAMKHWFAVFTLLSATATGQDATSLFLAGRVALPNVEGRIDHFSADLKGGRLFISALGNRTLEVVDVNTGRQIRSVPGVAEPQGVYYDAATNKLFAAGAGDGAVKVYDGSSFQLLATAKYSDDADNLRYDSRHRHVIVGYGDGALGFLDTDGKKVGEITLDAHPESFQLEAGGTRAFVNVPDRKEIQVADLSTNKVVAKGPLISASRNFPMALDEANHRLLIGCRTPARLLAIDTESGKQTASAEIAGDTDDLFYDAARKRVYVIGGEGFVDVLAQRDADHYERIARQATAPGARTGLFVPTWNKLFVAAPRRARQDAQILVFETR